MDHYESGFAVARGLTLKTKDDAPTLLRKYLERKGRRKVLAGIKKFVAA
jgi:hypothetical protein